jgi:DNA polymerase III subunit epsilon
VLELGWCVARANAERNDARAHWVQLPPGCAVDFRVRQLTGFREADAADALAPEEAWGLLRASADGGRMPTAIHYATFELAFLRDWAARFAPDAEFPFDVICVHAIARRLFPDLPRRSLRALAGFLGHGVHLTRRSLGHVEATAFIWRKLVAELAARGIRRWGELHDWLAGPGPRRSNKRRYPMPKERYRVLPDQPGVYRFLRSNGDLLYVGKAASLRKRVASHFSGISRATERALEMLTQVHDIDVTPTATPLEAALLEDEEIKARRPPYNVQLVPGDPRTWFSTPELDDASPRPDERHRRGPLPSTFSVRALGAIQALAAGADATLALRARAVEEAERWAPPEDVFAAGFARFAERHGTAGASSEQAVLAAARRLLIAGVAEADEDDAPERDRSLWDAERVLRHLERAVASGYQLLQRARWLCLLYDSAVVFQEPTCATARVLRVQDGRVRESGELRPDAPVPDGFHYRPLRERQLAFDRSRYDHLRTLTTELKRVVRDHGTAAVRVGRARWLRGSVLGGILQWV